MVKKRPMMLAFGVLALVAPGCTSSEETREPWDRRGFVSECHSYFIPENQHHCTLVANQIEEDYGTSRTPVVECAARELLAAAASISNGQNVTADEARAAYEACDDLSDT